jgi:hypothetical protein
MNIRWKVALLTLLGFSASACCGTKKAAKSEDKKEADIIVNENEDPRIQLMYGVPFPDGSVARPVDENGNPIVETPAADNEAVRFPDGSIAKPVTEEDAQKTLEAIRAEKEANAKAEAEAKK